MASLIWAPISENASPRTLAHGSVARLFATLAKPSRRSWLFRKRPDLAV